MEGGTPSSAPQNPDVDPMVSILKVDVPDDNQEQQEIISTGVIKEPSGDKERPDRGILALHVAAMPGFIRRVQILQASCLSLCNTTRETHSMQRLIVRSGIPPSMLALAYPTWHQEGAGNLSRVVPHGRVLMVYWISDAPFRFDCRNDTLDIVSVSSDGSIDMSEARWPPGTKEVALDGFNRRIDTITWPPGLETLWFGKSSLLNEGRGMFDMPLDGVMFPDCLREIFFGEKFNQPVDGIEWSKGLEVLSLPGFNQPIRDVQWPPGLKSLEFVSRPGIELWKTGETDGDFDGSCGQGCFNQPLGTTLPSSLETLWLSHAFNQSLNSVAWPTGIVTLGLTFNFRRYPFVEGIQWPSRVHDLFIYNTPNQRLSYPDGCNVVGMDFDPPAEHFYYGGEGYEEYDMYLSDGDENCYGCQRY